MATRRDILQVLGRLAFALDVLGEGGGRGQAFGAAAWTLRKAPEDLEMLYRAGRLGELPGIGPAVVEVVGAVFDGREVPRLAELEGQIPAGVMEIGKLRGLGPKKVRALWKELDIASLGELEYAINENRLLELKGFGAKTQAKVKASIADVRRFAGHFRLDQGCRAAEALTAALRTVPGVADIALVGDARRSTETLTRVDVLVRGAAAEAIRELLSSAGELEIAGEAGLPDGGPHGAPIVVTIEGIPSLAVACVGEVRVAVFGCPSEAAWGGHQLLLTGSEAHLDALRAVAAERGWTLDAAGLTGDGAPETRGEDSVYAALGLFPTAPERREAGVPLVHKGSARPRLVRREDLLGTLHTHTVASDGTATLEEMRHAAIAEGLSYLGISEHSESAFYASGLTADALATQRVAIDALNSDPDGERCRLLKGVESDILADGNLDYDDTILRDLEFVVASIHSRHGHGHDQMTARIIRAARDPRATVIGHPTGRLLLSRPPTPFDVEAFLDACVEGGCSVELNCNPQRLDLNETHLAAAKERGLKVSISADAHSTAALGHLGFGVSIARRAGLTPEDVLNCRSVDELLAWLRARNRAAYGGSPVS